MAGQDSIAPSSRTNPVAPRTTRPGPGTTGTARLRRPPPRCARALRSSPASRWHVRHFGYGGTPWGDEESSASIGP